MIEDPGFKVREAKETGVRSKRLTFPALVDRLAARPWLVAFASFAVTAPLIKSGYLGIL